ncbi:N-carbamyl-L-amino acid amidohydrolase [Komagataeibacter diospyri]|uniref:Zn-dependent hydrolase n=1 Tax=Komagataeibacter diospyri TaxID=1932662 RepID=UPI00113E6D1D|nr:Zn-dependent hydrolase [Komagataeibacter diospyri]GCE88528.1 N-carbamyl-L-amino acid amidohydrolase [Komagataeibacter diospyri]
MASSSVSATVVPVLDPDLGRSVFDRLHEIGFDGRGMTRPSYSEGENLAHGVFETVAREHGLEVRRDWAANLFVTLPGRNRDLPVVMTGSHADTVPCGGNFDGAAGAVAGLLVLCAWARAGYQPERDATLIVTRAEESVWFPLSYLGSRTAFGLLDATALATPRSDDGVSLRDHMLACGAQPDLCGRATVLQPARIDCFVELHIEQGPVLIEADVPVGIVTGICGSTRYRSVVIHGQYAHSGATPRRFRSDAVMAGASMMMALEAAWKQVEAEGEEMTLTFGVCQTDPAQANFAAVPGRLELVIDIRSRDENLLERMNALVIEQARRAEAEYNVTVDLGPRTRSMPAIMDAVLQADAKKIACALDIPAISMPSGAGHDAATFAGQGIPTEMLFVRNANGSHNPDESMEFPDFLNGVQVLEHLLRQRASRG